MADHVRQRIRERVVTDVTGLSTTGSRVVDSAIYPQASGDLPGLCVYAKSETSEPVTLGTSRLTDRTLEVVVQGYVESNSDFANVCDDISKEVETAIAGDRTLNGLAKDSYLTSTDIDYDSSGSKPAGVVTLVFTVEYLTLEASPDTPQ